MTQGPAMIVKRPSPKVALPTLNDSVVTFGFILPKLAELEPKTVSLIYAQLFLLPNQPWNPSSWGSVKVKLAHVSESPLVLAKALALALESASD